MTEETDFLNTKKGPSTDFSADSKRTGFYTSSDLNEPIHKPYFSISGFDLSKKVKQTTYQGEVTKLLDGTKLTPDNIQRFVNSANAQTFNLPIEQRLSELNWKLLVLTRKSKLDDSDADKEFGVKIDQFSEYIMNKNKKQEPIFLDNDDWNNQTVLQMMLDAFPKTSDASLKDATFYLATNSLIPAFNFSDKLVESETASSILKVISLYGQHRITKEEEKVAVTALLNKLGRRQLASFKSFVGTGSLSTFDKFIILFGRFCDKAREARADAENFG